MSLMEGYLFCCYQLIKTSFWNNSCVNLASIFSLLWVSQTEEEQQDQHIEEPCGAQSRLSPDNCATITHKVDSLWVGFRGIKISDQYWTLTTWQKHPNTHKHTCIRPKQFWSNCPKPLALSLVPAWDCLEMMAAIRAGWTLSLQETTAFVNRTSIVSLLPKIRLCC